MIIPPSDEPTAKSVMIRHVLKQALSQDFMSFLRKAFATTQPATEFLPNWHLELLAEYLNACERREIRRLIINVPPRSLKSLTVSVAWPAFLLGHTPSDRIMVASYAQGLSLKHALDTRLIMQSGWYRRLFPHTRIMRDENEKHKFVTTARGYRFATSIGGVVTGEGGNILIVDDPLSALQAMSEPMRTHANEWFDTSFSTRLDDKQQGVIIVVMQRLHAEDLTGHLLKKGGWESLLLPAIAMEACVYDFGRVKRIRAVGEALHEGRESLALLEQAQRELGSAAFAAQYQQSPLSDTSSMVKLGWLKRYVTPPEGMTRITQSWDTAIKAGSEHDRSVCLTFGETAQGYYLLHAEAIRVEYPELVKRTIAYAEHWQPHAILIEDKASGQMLLQDIKEHTKLPVIAILPRGDKVSRMARVSAMIEAGRLFIPSHALWLSEFEAELSGFPEARHDDMVDALSQYLNWVRSSGFEKLSIRRV